MAVDTSVFEEDVTEATGSPLKSTRYILKVVRLELSDHAQYGPGVRWIFNVLDPTTKKIVEGYDNEPYQYFQTTGTRIQAPKPGQKVPKAYKFACAFLGRAIAIGESGSAIARELVGKKAEAFLVPNDNGNLAIAAIDPLGTNFPEFRSSANGSAPAPAPVAPPPPEPKYDESGELEF